MVHHRSSDSFAKSFLKVLKSDDALTTSGYSSSLRPGFEGCSQIMNDPLYFRFVCLEQDEIFPEHKTRCFLLS